VLAGGAKAFDVVINLATPFLYNPAAGNLLLDVRNFGGGGSVPALDAESSNSDAVSRVYTESQGVNAPTVLPSEQDTEGLVTQFTVTPVPEPGTAVFGFGLVVMGLARRRRA
jgi:hypothetical protein